MEQTLMRQTAQKLTKLRGRILEQYPFFGRLLLRLPFGFAACETAYTDMKKIVFDPMFASRLTDEALCFVIMHELMHCVLKHCLRATGKIHSVYNVACDIVVNSIILEAMGNSDIDIDGTPAMHITPKGTEGREHSAEEVYAMLLKEEEDAFSIEFKGALDNHEVWEEAQTDALTELVWDNYVKQAAKCVGVATGIPKSIARYTDAICHTPKISWKQILHDYIQNDRYDYDFMKPDHRYAGECILPAFREDIEGTKLERVFFFIDTSGSVMDEAVAESFEEIKDAIEQIGNVSGVVFFFDGQVSQPYPFETMEDIENMKPIGGGGTSFQIIFDRIEQYPEDERPAVVIIMTDGYAVFPAETAAMQIPVIWLMIDSDVKAPWGECLHIHTEKK